jgi:hypothetical protein
MLVFGGLLTAATRSLLTRDASTLLSAVADLPISGVPTEPGAADGAAVVAATRALADQAWDGWAQRRYCSPRHCLW